MTLIQTRSRLTTKAPPDQRAQPGLDRRPASQRSRLPAPIAAKARAVPADQRLGTDDGQNLKDRRKPAVKPDQDPAILVREPDATLEPAPQNSQLMPKHRVLSLKLHLRFDWRGQDGQDETQKPDLSVSSGVSSASSTRIRFSVHTGRVDSSRAGKIPARQVKSFPNAIPLIVTAGQVVTRLVTC